LVRVKGISSGRLYQKMRWSYKLNFWDITQNLFHKNCFIEIFKNWVYWTKWLLLLKNKISEKLTEGKISYCTSTLQARFLSMHAGKTFQNIFKTIKRRTCTFYGCFRSYLRFSKRYVDENSTIRFSVKIYTNS
jgi:hypothetical protein